MSLEQKVGSARQIIYEAFERYGNQLSFCYNGGKDSVVLLDLVLKCAKKANISVRPFYLEVDDEFDEMIDFISYTEKYWNINVTRINAVNLKDGLTKLIDEYQINSVFLGVRADDIPNAPLHPFEPTTNGWPNAERVMPILDWSYSDIWEYIDKFNLPYCSLYEEGYTSIGPKALTVPNPKLYDPETGKYKHARNLVEARFERLGRSNRSY